MTVSQSHDLMHFTDISNAIGAVQHQDIRKKKRNLYLLENVLIKLISNVA